MSLEKYEDVYLRGMHFRGSHAKEYVDQLTPGQQLYLKREPENAHDSNAIQVWTRPLDEGEEVDGAFVPTGFHFAYVAAETAQWLAPSMDEGKTFICEVTGVDRSGKTAYPVCVIEEKLEE